MTSAVTLLRMLHTTQSPGRECVGNENGNETAQAVGSASSSGRPRNAESGGEDVEVVEGAVGVTCAAVTAPAPPDMQAFVGGDGEESVRDFVAQSLHRAVGEVVVTMKPAKTTENHFQRHVPDTMYSSPYCYDISVQVVGVGEGASSTLLNSSVRLSLVKGEGGEAVITSDNLPPLSGQTMFSLIPMHTGGEDSPHPSLSSPTQKCGYSSVARLAPRFCPSPCGCGCGSVDLWLCGCRCGCGCERVCGTVDVWM